MVIDQKVSAEEGENLDLGHVELILLRSHGSECIAFEGRGQS